MTDHIHEQISAFVDDELSFEESSFLVRRLTSDKIAREQTIRYAAIGSAMREDALLAHSALLRERIHAALDGVPARPFAASDQKSYSRAAMRIMTGAGVAATVAAVSLFALRSIGPADMDGLPVATQADTTLPNLWTEPASYVVPGESREATNIIVPPIRLTNYLVQHLNYTSTLQRASVHSNVVGVADPDSDPNEVDQAEAP